jgi:hypothetical protein
VGAQEQHDRLAVAVMAFDAGEGVQALAGEAFGEQRQEVRHAGQVRELVVADVQEPFDGLGAVGAVELAGEADRGGAQRELLVDGQVLVVVDDRVSHRGLR